MRRGMSRHRERMKRMSAVPTFARHGKLPKSSSLRTLTSAFLTLVVVLSVSLVCIGVYAAFDVLASVKPGVELVDREGKVVQPSVGAIQGAFNVLFVGSDSGGENPAYGDRDAALNDVTMLLHVSEDHQNATIISFPRDMFVAIPECPDPDGGYFSAMTRQKMNTTLAYGGLACTVMTVEKLTGLEIRYAGLIEFDGVIEMSNALGGVPVCVSGDIFDPYTGLDIKAGETVLQGSQALAFLRSRHGVGDGSDLARISSQQVFLSAMMRKLQDDSVLTDPVTLYSLAKAVTNNMQLSASMSTPSAIVSMALAVRNIDLDKIVFIQYPTYYVEGGVAPRQAEAQELFLALSEGSSLTLTGVTGVASEDQTPQDPPVQDSSVQDPEATPTETPEGETSEPKLDANGDVLLPNTVEGQRASQRTCTVPYNG